MARKVYNSPNAIRNEDVLIIRAVLLSACAHYIETISYSRHLLRNCLQCCGSVDFLHDKLSSGRPYKILTVLEECTQQAFCGEAKSKMGLADVLEALYRFLLKRGKPEYI